MFNPSVRVSSIIHRSRFITRGPHQKWWVFFAIAIGMFVVVMEQTGVNIALPKIAEHFDLDIPTVQWVTLGYVLSTSAMFMPLGRISDMIGRTRVYVFSFMIFMVAAAVGGSAPAFSVLIAAKIVQGVGSAGVQANAMAMMTDAFPGRERGKAVGLYTTVVGLGATVGPIIGGLLVSGFGWRSLFFANIPLGVIAVVSVLVVLGEESTPQRKEGHLMGFDWVGAGISSGALVSLLLGMSNGHRFGWGSTPIVASFLTAAGLLAMFIWWEIRSSDPMLDLTFFRIRVFSLGVLARFLLFLASAPRVILMPFYLIVVLNYKAYIAGLMMAPAAVSMAITGVISGTLSDRMGTRLLMLMGLALSASGMFIFSQLNLHSSPVHVVVAMMLVGSGMGTFYSPNTSAVLGSRDRGEYGIISALLNLTRTSGNVTGIAAATAIVTAVMASSGFEPSLSTVSEVGGEGVKLAFMSGLTKAFWASGGLILLAMLPAVFQGQARRAEPPSRQPSPGPGASSLIPGGGKVINPATPIPPTGKGRS